MTRMPPADEAALGRVVGDDFELHVGIAGALGGKHRGAAGLVALRRRLDELTGGTFATWRADSHDVATSAVLDQLSQQLAASH